jgi:hypothetical protein
MFFIFYLSFWIIFLKPPFDVEVLGVSSFKDRCMHLEKLNDELYNRRNFSTMAAHPIINLTGGIPEAR